MTLAICAMKIFLPVNTSYLTFFSQWPCWPNFCIELRVVLVLNASTRYKFVHHAAILVGSPYATHPSCLKLKYFETRQSSNSVPPQWLLILKCSYTYRVFEQTVMNAGEKYFHNQSQFWIRKYNISFLIIKLKLLTAYFRTDYQQWNA